MKIKTHHTKTKIQWKCLKRETLRFKSPFFKELREIIKKNSLVIQLKGLENEEQLCRQKEISKTRVEINEVTIK